MHLTSSLTQLVQPLTMFLNTMHTNPMCSQLIYPSVKVWNTLIGPVQLLIDTSSGSHGIVHWLQLSHNMILQLHFMVQS